MPLPEVLLLNPVTVILALTSTVFAVFSFVLLYKYLKEKNKASFITKNQDKSFAILNDAMKKAQEIIGKAAMQQANVVETSREQSQKLELAAEQNLQTTTKKADQLIEKEVQSLHEEFEKLKQDLVLAQNEYINYLKAVQFTSDQTKQIASEQMNRAISEQSMQIKSQLNNFVEQLESELTTFLHKSEEQSVHSLELELKSARQMVETYKQQQFVLIDENIIAILERTLSLVLSKKLTLKDHVDLVYESLEKAKLEKFIA